MRMRPKVQALVLSAILLTLVLIAGVLVVQADRDAIDRAGESQVRQMASQHASSVQIWVRERLADMDVMGQTPLLAFYLKQRMAPAEFGLTDAMLQRHLERVRDQYHYRSIALIDIVRRQTISSVGAPLSVREWERLIQHAGTDEIPRWIYLDGVSVSQFRVGLLRRVSDPQGQLLPVLLYMELNTERLTSSLQGNSPGMPRQGQSVLLWPTEDLRVRVMGRTDTRADTVREADIQALLAARDRPLRREDEMGINYHALSAVQGSPWVVVSSLGNDYFREAANRKLIMLGVALLVIAIVSVLVWIAWWRQRQLMGAVRAKHQMELQVMARTHDLECSNALLESSLAEREALQRQLQKSLDAEREAMTAQRQFFLMVSHEFRTPLSVIAAAAENLARNLTDSPADVHARVEKVRQATERLDSLIRHCLNEERMLAAFANPDTEAVDLDQLILQLLDELQFVREHRLRFRSLCSLDPVWPGDREAMAMALSSLVDNACKYSPPDSDVTITLRDDPDCFYVSVQDHGQGIAQAEMPRIFDKFYRAATASGVSGAGLGLYWVRRVAMKYGGDVDVLSTEGVGTLFTLRLPRVMPKGAD